jgi:hypothetical protein
VPAVALHSNQRPKRRLQAIDERGGRHIAEVAGREHRQKLQADVRRRGTVRDPFAPVFLHVVRYQPVVRRRDEVVEVPPRPPRDEPEREPFAGFRRGVPAPCRHASRVGDQRRYEPQREHGHRAREARGGFDGDENSGRGSRERRRQEPERNQLAEPDGVRSAVSGDPLQETPLREQDANQRPPDGIEHRSALMQQERGRQEGLPRPRHQRVGLRTHVIPKSHSAHPARQRSPDLHVRGEGEHEQRY